MDAVIYLRVSTKEQAAKDESGEGYSIPAQREACLRHIAERRWNLAGEFTDAGQSARTADRPMLKALLHRVAEGGVGAVVVHKIDRLARSMEDHVAIRAAPRHAGVQLVALELLKVEQDRIGGAEQIAKAQLEAAEGDLEGWQDVLRTAIRLAGNCHAVHEGATVRAPSLQ